MRKVGPTIQEEIRKDRRLWDSADSTLRAPRTWEEAHKVVLEYEAREATNKAAASSVLTTTTETFPAGNNGGGGKGNRNAGGGGQPGKPSVDKALADQLASLKNAILTLQKGVVVVRGAATKARASASTCGTMAVARKARTANGAMLMKR